MGTWKSVKPENNGRSEIAGWRSWTDNENRQVVLAHNDAVTAMRYDFDSEEYWNYLAQRVGMPLAQVREYWERNPNYTGYAAPGAAPGASRWTFDENHQVVLAHNDAVTNMHFVLNSEEYWIYLAQRVGKPLAEVREYWRRNPIYINYGGPVANLGAAENPRADP